MSKIQIKPIVNLRRLQKAIRITYRLILALQALVEKDQFYTRTLKSLAWRLSNLHRFLEKEKEMIDRHYRNNI